MDMCRACRVNPGAMNIKGFPLCYQCAGKGAHTIGMAIGATTTPSASTTSNTKASLITLGMGAFLLAAIAGTLWLYSQPSHAREPVRFGFGLK